jgi:hypothetical protein
MFKLKRITMNKKFYTLLLGISLALLVNTGIVKAQPAISNSFFEEVDYVGAFGSSDWTEGWANWTPQSTAYPAAVLTIPAGDITTNLVKQFLHYGNFRFYKQ